MRVRVGPVKGAYRRQPALAAGYSLIELIFIVGIMAVLGAIAGLQIIEARPAMQGDGAMRVVLAQLRMARELAITERRCIRVALGDPATVSLVREEVPGPATTTLSTTALESGMAFALIDGIPDTPDAFGRDTATDFGTATVVKFTPDGTLVDQDGNTVNGTIFISQPTSHRVARAITVLGSTGRVRGFRWNGRLWTLV